MFSRVDKCKLASDDLYAIARVAGYGESGVHSLHGTNYSIFPASCASTNLKFKSWEVEVVRG